MAASLEVLEAVELRAAAAGTTMVPSSPTTWPSDISISMSSTASRTESASLGGSRRAQDGSWPRQQNAGRHLPPTRPTAVPVSLQVARTSSGSRGNASQARPVRSRRWRFSPSSFFRLRFSDLAFRTSVMSGTPATGPMPM